MKDTYENITEHTIELLVYKFYEKVREDEALGPIFKNKIGESREDWASHLKKMVDFWSSLMLGTNRFQGTPMQKHLALPTFDLSLFETWLKLFKETVSEIHFGSAKDLYIEKSERIARSIKMGIQINRASKPNE